MLDSADDTGPPANGTTPRTVRSGEIVDVKARSIVVLQRL
jgi:hypothetical protein